MTNDAYRVHTFLREIRNLNTLLTIKKLEQEDMFNKAQGCGSFSAELKVQTSPKGDAMELAVARLVELEDEYQQIFMQYIERKDLAVDMMHDLTQDEQSILKLYYMHGDTDERISEVIHLTRSRITQLRHHALDKIGKYYLTEQRLTTLTKDMC